MKLPSLIVFFALTAPAGASTRGYDLKMKLSLDGKPVASPRVTVREGEPATLTQQSGSKKQFIEVVAVENTELSDQGIFMKFVIGTIEKDGGRTVLSRPRVIVRENQTAQIVQNDSKSGKQLMSLSVTAKRKAL